MAAPNSYTFQTVISPGDPVFTQLLGINNSGTVAGYFGDGKGVPNNGFTLVLPNSTNDKGQLVGFYVDANGNTDGFVATPTPEPGSLLLLGSGMLAGLGILRRKINLSSSAGTGLSSDRSEKLQPSLLVLVRRRLGLPD
jgi:hypothetical protein